MNNGLCYIFCLAPIPVGGGAKWMVLAYVLTKVTLFVTSAILCVSLSSTTHVIGSALACFIPCPPAARAMVPWLASLLRKCGHLLLVWAELLDLYTFLDLDAIGLYSG